MPELELGPNRFPDPGAESVSEFRRFGYPAAFTPGTLGRNTFEGPG